MEAQEILSSLTGAGVTAGGAGGMLYWFIKRTITEVYDDLKGLSIKIDKVDDKYQAKICELENRCTALEAKK